MERDREPHGAELPLRRSAEADVDGLADGRQHAGAEPQHHLQAPHGRHGFLDGTYTLPVGLTYRYSDSMLVDLEYVALGGAFAFPTGFFRDRSQLAVRLTYLLN